MTDGDVVVIESLSRLGRSAKDLIELTELFHAKGVNLVSLKESIDTNTSLFGVCRLSFLWLWRHLSPLGFCQLSYPSRTEQSRSLG